MLTKLQMSLYWREFAKAKAAAEQLRGEVMTSIEADEFRHRCHTQAGAPESSKVLNNKTLDTVLAAFFSWSHSASIAHQGRQLDQPVTRCRYVADDICDRIRAALIVQDRAKQAESLAPGKPRDAYLLYLLKRLSGQDKMDLQDYTVTAWTKLISLLMVRYDQVARQHAGTGNAKRVRPVDSNVDMHQCELGIDQPAYKNRWDMASVKRAPEPVAAQQDEEPF